MSELCGPANWGDLPGWIEALATVGALIAAIGALRHNRAANERERRRDDDRETERRQDTLDRREREDRAQAIQISAWAPENPSRGVYHPALSDVWVPEVVVRNWSDHPIRDVRVTWLHLSGFTQQKPVVTPGTDGEFSLDNHYPPAGTLFELHFTDNANRRWLRAADGQLTPVPDST